MSETPQAVLERYIRDGGIITLPHIREAIRAVLDVVRVQYEANEEMTRVLSSAEAERVRAEKFWASAQERADVANVALLDAVKVRGQLRAAEAALRIIAGEAQCADNLMSNVEVARAALAPEGKLAFLDDARALYTETERKLSATDSRMRQAEAEVARLRDIISPSDAAAYEEGMAALRAEVERLRAQWDAGVLAGMRATAEQHGQIVALRRENQEWQDRCLAWQVRAEKAEAALRGMVERYARHSGLCVPVIDGKMGKVTLESCVCDPLHKQARAALCDTAPAEQCEGCGGTGEIPQGLPCDGPIPCPDCATEPSRGGEAMSETPQTEWLECPCCGEGVMGRTSPALWYQDEEEVCDCGCVVAASVDEHEDPPQAYAVVRKGCPEHGEVE